jgi:hypothetical protein
VEAGVAPTQARLDGFVVALLFVGAFRHYGWPLLPNEMQRFAWNASGSILVLALLWALAWPAARLVVIWLTFEELQVIACSLIRMLRPVDIGSGQAQCSALIGFNLGAVGLMLMAVALVAQTVRTTGYLNGKKK